MGLAAKALGAGVVALGLGGMGAPLAVPQQTQTAPAQNSVPEAPKPQTLPSLNTITPAAPAVPGGAVPMAPTPQPGAAENGGITPGTTLPAAPAPENQAQTAPVPAQTPGQQAPASHFVLHYNVNFVQVPFTVKDSKGHLVPGITWREVKVYENNVQQHLSLFTVDPLPLSVALVIDQSVTEDTMKKINASLDALQAAFTPYDEVAIFTYNNGVQEQTGFTGAQSLRANYALEASKSQGREPLMPMGGPLAQTTVKNNEAVDPNTNGNNNVTLMQGNIAPREYHTLNDAILTAAQTVAKAGKGRRRVVYVISDGKEYGSQAKEKEVIRFLQANQIAVYATLVGDTSMPGVDWLDKFHLPLTMRDNALPRYVSQTGGDYDAAFRPQTIQNDFSKLTEEVRIEYTLGYYSHEPFIDGKFRSIDVRVLRPDLEVIAEKGYYPRPEQPSTPVPTASPTAPAGNTTQ